MANAKAIIREGFWYSKAEKNLPVPIEGKKYKNQDLVIEKLKAFQKRASMKHMKGFSNCRICGKRNGSGEYDLETKTAKIIWPEGFMHYVAVHNVKPSKDLLDQLNLGLEKKKPVKVPPVEAKKPHIDEVFLAFQSFQNESIRAVTSAVKHKQALHNLKEKMQKFGLLDAIDWNDPTS